uniref:C-x(9)-C motif containing 4 homolog (S. cerevisiae) n=1 Tax=Cyprinus carpio TaxID=7962 RepID=A0A8C1YLW5_CYPCA
MPQKEPCQKQACFNRFMTCVFLTANKYIASLCEDVIQAMRKCCEVHAGENSVCSGFTKQHTSTDTKTPGL